MVVQDEPVTVWRSKRPADLGAAAHALGWDGCRLWAAGPGCWGTLRADPDGEAVWEPSGDDPSILRAGATALCAAPGGMWIALPFGVAHHGARGWTLVDDTSARGWASPLVMVLHESRLWAGFADGRIAVRDGDPLADRPDGLLSEVWRLPAAVRDLAPGAGGWLAAGDAGVHLLRLDHAPIQLSAEPSRALLPDGGSWVVGARGGITRLRPRGGDFPGPQNDADLDGPPVRDVWCLSAAPDGTLWAGGPRGLMRRDDAGWHYHQGPRWLPDDRVHALVATGDALWALTAGGPALLTPHGTTMAAKAHALQARLESRHLRLDRFVEETVLPAGRSAEAGLPTLSDNDGLWTGMYLAAQAYRYAVTGDAQARRQAERSFDALEWLEAVTTIPGYPTKAIVPTAERPADGTWYPSADGRWMWKGDCSSDEIVGHMYAYSLYFDLVADADGRRRVAALVRRILGHIVANGLRIMEFGQRTRWGVWNPEALNGEEGRWGDRGLNSLEILSHLRVGSHMTGDPTYDRLFAELAEQHDYVGNVDRTKVDAVGHVNHSDDELAFLAYDPLLRYERNGELRARYLASLRRAWAWERPERNPLWNFIYAAHAAQDAATSDAVADGVQTLRELPLDTVAWPVRNSGRDDIVLDPRPDRHGALQATRVLPYDELAVTRWNGNPYQCDSGNARVEGDGVHYLLPYWMGRFHGWIGS